MAATCRSPTVASSTTRTDAIEAPLPPNQRWRCSHAGNATRSRPAMWSSSEVVVEPLLGTLEAEHGPDRSRLLGRQPDERAATLPERTFAGDQVVHLVRLVLVDPEPFERNVEDRLLRPVRVEADRDEHQTGLVVGDFGVEGHALAVGAVETQVAVVLQRAMV